MAEKDNVDIILKEFDIFKNKYNKITNDTSNKERRGIYADGELLIMRIDQIVKKVSEKDSKNLLNTKDEISNLTQQINLLHAQRKYNIIFKILDNIDEILRFFAVWGMIVFASIFIALPCLILSPLDNTLVSFNIISPAHQIAVLAKRFIAYCIINISGINLVVEGAEGCNFGHDSGILCYSHSSTLDIFIFSLAVPVRAFSLGKAELFLIPFFSWCLLAFGCFPIDRSNRDQAVQALKAATDSTVAGDCVAVAPEGTRSKNGQILPFKKGPFYMWESLKIPVIPLVIYGAYELYPKNKKMTMPGKVYARFLTPIQSSDVNSRDEMLNTTRKRMLEAWKDCPEDASVELSWPLRIKQIFSVSIFYIVVYLTWKKLQGPISAIKEHFGWSSAQFFGVFMVISVTITLSFYIYLLYLSNPINKFLSIFKNKQQQKRV